ncbi:MAG: type II restriction endonuclease [Luteolibacter sp.]
MSFGQLSQVFSCFAWKQLTSVEVDPNASNGHEFNSSPVLREILGDTSRKGNEGNGIPTRFIYLSDNEEEIVDDAGNMSWYDSRANHPTRTEWRLYYSDNAVIGREGRARAGDSMIIAFKADISSATVFAAPAGSTSENQLRWLFGITAEREKGFVTAVVKDAQIVDMTRARILEAAGVEIIVKDDALLERILELFGENFPTTAKFGNFIRKEVSEVKAQDGSDEAIMSWMESEEYAFRVLERHIVNKRLEQKFEDVDDFVSYSLSVHNRRKARAGLAFENHLAEIFREHGLTFERGVTLEAKAKPDFLFPSKKNYLDQTFPDGLLTLLGAKTSCKDRWRQVLAESVRVKDKHLVTLQPSISTDQLEQMRSHHLQLVIPEAIHVSYPQAEKSYLWNLETFIAMVRDKQTAANDRL